MEWWKIVLIVLMSMNVISALIGIWFGTGDGDRFKDLSWFGYLNWNFFQWFGFRLSKGFEPLQTIEINPEQPKVCRVSWYLMLPIIPWTGWWSDFVPQRYLRLRIWRYEK